MRKAVDRLMAAVKSGEKITIHGDYDADGVSGSVILQSTLKELGADVDVYLPHREKEGYGLSAATIETLSGRGARVIVTCDCGISNAAEIELAAAKGIDVIIADHHTLPERLPPAHAILHPLRDGETYPFRHLTGGGVAFKLCQALWREAGLPAGKEKWLLDMVSISTVADFGALVGENRALVHYGLVVLNKTQRPGLASLIEAAQFHDRKIDTGTIGFQIAPRINAAGRMDHADGALRLLTADSKEAVGSRAEILNQHNRDRRSATDKLIAEARLMAREQASAPAIVISGDGWPAALCGLVAAKLVDDSYRPTIVLGRQEISPLFAKERAGGVRYVGSGRSIPEFDVTAGLKEASEFIKKFGGHPMACGLTIEGDENFERFKKRFVETAAEKLEGVELVPSLNIEEAVYVSEVTLKTMELLERLEPHGEGNPKPLFLIRGAKVAAAQAIGENGKHLRMMVYDDTGARLKLIAFGMGERAHEALSGAIDVVVELGVNEWNNRREPQGRVIDFHPSVCHPERSEGSVYAPTKIDSSLRSE